MATWSGAAGSESVFGGTGRLLSALLFPPFSTLSVPLPRFNFLRLRSPPTALALLSVASRKKSASSISRYSSSSAGDPLPLLQSDLLDLLFRIIASYGNPYWPTIKDSATLFEAADASWLSTRGAAGGRDDSPPPQHPIVLSYAEFDPFPAASPLLDFMLAGSSPCSRAQEA